MTHTTSSISLLAKGDSMDLEISVVAITVDDSEPAVLSTIHSLILQV